VEKRTITDKIDNVTVIPEECQSVTPPCPHALKIELTAHCDFRCSFCATALKLREQSEMDKEFFKKAVKDARDSGVEEIGLFFLGESFLCKWLPEAIDYAKNVCKFPYVFLTTNGRLAKKETVRKCMEAGLDSLKFSFNSSDEEQFEEMARVPGKNFHIVVQNIKDAYAVREELGADCGLYLSSIRYDGEQFEKMEESVAELRPYVDEHYWLPLYSQAGLNLEQMEAMGKKPVIGNFGRYGAPFTTDLCFALFREARITWDGKMSGCCFNHTHEFDMGDLNEVTFMEAWHSQKYQGLRRAMLARDLKGTPCENCWTYPQN